MATIEFTRASLREAITKKYDEKVAVAEEKARAMTDPNTREERRKAWRERCESLIRGVMAQINEAEDHGTHVPDGTLIDFGLPPYPSKPDSYDARDAQRNVESAKADRKRYLARVEAMTTDKITLTPKQLTDYFGL